VSSFGCRPWITRSSHASLCSLMKLPLRYRSASPCFAFSVALVRWGTGSSAPSVQV